ncbi:CBS domain-containing protein [Pelagibius sp. CAU 1746]|uniref:CBS domain-containing protein n=1 Tax=Pelagibius sp. CAU 1746 TaxID=3140370 RepID=UPI00325C059C
MNIKIADLMAKRVISAQPHHSVDHLRGLMERNRIHAVPVVGPEGEAAGIVTTADVARKLKGETPVKRIMTTRVYCVPAYNDVSAAARVMRKHRIHHVVVTHEKRVVGILSSLDLLKLVEGHRFTAKNAPAPGKKARKSA